MKSPVATRAETAPKEQVRHQIPPSLLLAAPALLLAVTAILRYLNGRAMIDLVIYDQGVWAASRGGQPSVSVIRDTLLGDHFGPGIFVFAPLYRLVATPVWLLAGQVLAAWVAVRMIARRLEPTLGDLRAALVGGALLLSPPIAYALLFDFHSVVLAVPFALAAVFAIEDGRPRRAVALGLLAALFRIEVGLGVAAALVVWPGPRRGRLAPGALLLAYLAVAMYFDKALGQADYWATHYGHLGESPMQALAHPLRLTGAVLGPSSLRKALPWLGTGAFLCLRKPRRMAPALVVALPVLLSGWPGTESVVFQYGFAPTLLLALAWMPALQERPDRARLVMTGSLLLAGLLGPVFPAFASADPMGNFAGRYWVPDGESRCIVAGMPVDASVSAVQPLTFIAHRKDLYLWPYPFQGPPSLVLPADFLARGDPALAPKVDYLIVPRRLERLVAPGFVADGEGSTFLRFRRAATTAPTPHPPSCR